MATIVDVAKRAGVAVTTVSRVMNNKGQVSEETRQRVLDAISELAYRPSPAARGLPRRRLHMVSVVVPFVTNPSAVARVQGVVHGLRSTDYPVSILDVERPEHQEEHFGLLGSGLRPEGAVIVSLHPSENQLASFRAAGTCPVFIDTDVADFSRVFVDDRHGGFLATQHLIQLGHRRIGFIGDKEDERFGFTSSRLRRRGYRDALQAAGLDAAAHFERTGEHGRDTSAELARELLALPEPPTAIFASSDTQAIGVLDVAKEAGLQVPRDLSVIGFDDIEVAGFLGLTTVRHPLYESGLIAADLVIEHIENPGCTPRSVEQDLEVIVRVTTGPPPAQSSN
ncbi:MAG: LacI family DNA-binding transcriptional regulator [Acidimicrobiia bacterium]|nr:LacI family DNA-binding transcriptional regulator [Acidimicrobiia bacterium]